MRATWRSVFAISVRTSASVALMFAGTRWVSGLASSADTPRSVWSAFWMIDCRSISLMRSMIASSPVGAVGSCGSSVSKST